MTAQEWPIAATKTPCSPRACSRFASRGTPRAQRNSRSAFTLAEALIASVFLAVTALGVAATLAAASQQAQDLAQSANCQALARELIEEVSSKSFTTQPNPGWSNGGRDRSTFDDAADYDGYTDTSTTGIKTLQGTVVNFNDGATYTRTVAFEYRTTPNGSKVSSGDFGMVTVTVTASTGISSQLQAMLSLASTQLKR
jgi:Tfp pilus assembly protein PilV